MSRRNKDSNENNSLGTFDENEFDEELFEHSLENQETDDDDSGKKRINGHVIFFVAIALLFVFAMVRLFLWNISGEDSGYNPTEDTSEFDTEPLDYIQPLNSDQLAGKPDDGVTTIFCFGNSTFADNGAENGLAKAIGERYNATVINAGFADSFQSLKYTEYNPDDFPQDGLSLYHVTNALVNGDFSTVDTAAERVSEEAAAKADYLKTVDLSTADMVVIMYDLMDYVDHRPVTDPNNSTNLLTFTGSLQASIQMIQEKYPYIRIVVVSIPASGKTIDGFYVDGDIHDLGNGTLSDYLGHEANTAISCGISFIDSYFGIIHVENRDQYLVDDYHLNEAGCEAIADRIQELIVLNE